MHGWLFLLASFMADGRANSVTLASERVEQWQVDVTLDDRIEPPPRQTETELDLTFHLTSPDGNTEREVYQRLDESGSPFDLALQAQQVRAVWMGFDHNTFLAVTDDGGDLTLDVFRPGSQTATMVDLGSLKQLGVFGVEPTFATQSGSLEDGGMTICIPADGGKDRAATLLRWRIARKSNGDLLASRLSPDVPLPAEVIGDSTQMRLADSDDLSDTASSRQELFTQTLSNHWQLAGELVSRLTGTSDLGNSFAVDLVLEVKSSDGGPRHNLLTTVASVDQANEPQNVDLHPLAAAWDRDRVLLLYESSYRELHLFIWDPAASDALQSHRDVLVTTLRDLHADQFDWGLARLSGSLEGVGLTVTFGITRDLKPASIPVRVLVKKDPSTGEFSVRRIGM